MKTHIRCTLCLIAWTLTGQAALLAQTNSAQLASNSRGYNPAYGQLSNGGYHAPAPNANYYTPGEYLPTPRGSQTAAPTQAPAAPQPPYAYPSAPGIKAPVAEKAPAKSGEDLEALRRDNQLLNERLRAQMSQENRGYLSPATQLTYVNHTVRRGDTLWGLAIKYKSSSNAIQQANQLPKGKLLRGATIRIPVQSTAAVTRPTYYAPMPPPPYEEPSRAKPSAPSQKPAVKSGTHLVKSGETLGILSQHYGVSVAELRSANQLRSSHWIYVGQRLVIPGRSEAEIAELAKKPVPTAPPAPTQAHIPPYSYPGKSLKPVAAASIPKAAATTPTAAAKPVVQAPVVTHPNRGVTSYRIQQGDTIQSVAAAYKVSTTELRDYNRLPSDQLPAPGKTLLVPTPAIVSL